MENLLINRLKLITGQIREFTSSALSICDQTAPIDVVKAEIISKKLDTAVNRFTTELHNYFRLNLEPAADEISAFSEIQLKGEEVLAELTIKIKVAREGEVTTATNKTKVLAGKLPKLNLPEFGGNILEWHQFWDQFESNIGNRNLPDVDKLLYLKSSLTGDARKSIDGLETTNKNYEIAVTTLKNRYGRENHIIDAHYAALNRIKPVNGDNVAELRNSLNEIERHLRVLKSLGEDINHNHLRFLIMEKMPADVVYEMKIKDKIKTIDDIREHLENIIAAKEDTDRFKTDHIKEEYTTQSLHTNTHQEKGNPGHTTYKFNEDRRDNNFRNNRRGNNFRENRIGTNFREENKGINFNKNKFEFRTGNKVKFNSNIHKRRPLKRKLERQDAREENPRRKKKRIQCIFCTKPHYNDQCRTFRTVEERKAKIKERCFKCLGKHHRQSNCKRQVYCIHCGEHNQHSRALCPKYSPAKQQKTNNFYAGTNSSTILQTAVVTARHNDKHSLNTQCRILLDSGSQRTYITQKVAKELNLPTEEESRLSVFTFGSKTPQIIESNIVKLEIKTRTNENFVIYANVVPHISHGVPYPDTELSDWKDKVVLADDGSLSSDIDILLGNDYFFSLILHDRIKLDDNLFLIDTKFGWILTGKSTAKNVDVLSAITYFQSVENKLTPPDLPLEKENLKCLWDLESIGICDSPKTTRDEETIQQFNDTIELIDNRYTVRWPWIDYPPDLPSNFGLAFGRLVNLLKRMDLETLLSYNSTLEEQIEKGIIEYIPDSELDATNIEHPIHYLPHHGVSQPNKPIRIVYDASAKTKESKSLNECLHCGPLMLEDLTGMLLRFRSHQIGITADVEKAFLQIALQHKDKDVTRFLWLKDLTKPAVKENLLHLRFCRVPFGIISSPFLLNATLKHHLLSLNEDILKRIVNDIYVDNLVSGADSAQEAKEMYKSCKRAFLDISMNLREWNSNSNTFNNSIPPEDMAKDTYVKVLGLNWSTKEDTIQLRYKKGTDANTKREVLRNVASIYDPCGYAVPELLPAKLFLQKLWLDKYKWDAPLPDNLTSEWRDMSDQLESTREIIIPRKYFVHSDENDIQLHIFTDASIKAYAAAAYISNGKEVSFVIGKSRLVPIKDQENLKIPRLELLGVLIGSRLLKYVKKFLHFNFTQYTIWTDSQIVIDWYYSNKLLPPFVSRRIQEIKKNASVVIRYVPTDLNPADVATRPMYSKTQRESWLSGPSYLLDDSKSWPTSRRSELSFLCGEGLPEEDEIPESEHNSSEKEIDQDTPREQEGPEEPPVEEAENFNSPLSLTQEIKLIQKEFFPDELEGKETNLRRNLGLFTDVDGILRCKGRLSNTEWSYDKRYPILIPKNCDFTSKLIMTTHEENYHVGVNHTLSIIRLSYWIPQGRSQVQKILKKCPKCVKHGGGPFKLPPTPALPKPRVTYSSPFTYTGLDYLGPLQVKTNNKTEKRWICLYTCLAVRAIHLEVVEDLTAEECLLALRRFISSRGIPTVIISDNALQFKLTAEVLASNYCISNKIQWKFIPQLAPWHGGFYERLVGLVKHCLKRTLAKSLLVEKQLTTVIKEIEAVLNTRPLTCVGSDLEDILKPSDFLALERCIVTTPVDEGSCPTGTTTKKDLVEGWKRGQNMLKDFKKMFVDQYLPSLRERYQHSHKEPRITKSATPRLGDIVQIKGDNKNRDSWKVGKIVALLKGADGQCRVARVKVGDTEFTRSINHLYPLEAELEVPENKETVNIPKIKNTTPTLVNLPASAELESSSQINDIVKSTPTSRDQLEYEPDSIHIDLNRNETNENEERIERNVDPPMEIDVSSVTESAEPNETDPNNETRQQRDASLKAREKIREWTRDLMDLL